MKTSWLLALCWALTPLNAISADPVEGPFKSEPAIVDVEKDGVYLRYHVSQRSSNRVVSGASSKVYVDMGIVGHGVEAYLSLSADVVVLDGETKKTLWARFIGGWYDNLSFIQATDSKTQEQMVLLRTGGKSGDGRFFEIRTGSERFLTRDSKGGLVASEEEKKELRGARLSIEMQFSGHDSRIESRQCIRITSQGEWRKLWSSHAGEKDSPPNIDFTKHMVVAIFHGKGYNSDGISIVEALDCEQAVELFVRDRSYQTGPDAHRVTAYGIFVVPKSAKELIVKEDCQGLIGGPPVWKIVTDLKRR